jgi:hypothetical protein
MDQQQ